MNEQEIKKSIEKLRTLPYLSKPYSSRSWGHKLHSLCSYQSKLKPSIAYFLSKLFTKKTDTVFEPFSGVGTIPFEIAQLGTKTVSLDVNSIAYSVTSAKLKPIPRKEIFTQLDELNKFIKTSKLSKEDYEYADDYIKRFYHEKTLEEILIAVNFFKNKGDRYSFIRACMLHILHGNRPYALSRRSHNITPYAPKGEFIYKNLIMKLREKVNRMVSMPLSPIFMPGKVYSGSIFDFNYDKKFDKIITSPPFVNSTRFLYNNRIRLWFNGESYKDQTKSAKLFVESYDITIFKKVLRKFDDLLKDDGLCIMHLGVVKNLDMGLKISEYGKDIGFNTIDIVYEDVKNKEKFGIKDQGATHKHQFLIMQKN